MLMKRSPGRYLFVASLLLIWTRFATGRTDYQNTPREFCQLETFEPQCWKNEVVVIQSAIYGRRHVGKCLQPEEAAISQDPRFIGCHADVLGVMNAKCSGRKQCSVRIPDSDLEQTSPCMTGLKMFLEVSYYCTEVVEEDRSCVVTLTSSALHIASSSSRQSNINCGTKTQPWLLEAPAGQRINISLLDFTDSQHLTRSTSHSSSSSSDSCVQQQKHQYGYIIDKSSVNKKNMSVCGADSNRQTHVYLSTSNQLQLVLNEEPGINFLLKTEAVGCTNLIPPEDSWLKREDDKITIGCYTSRQTWQLRCVDGRWTGVVSNCTMSAAGDITIVKHQETETDAHVMLQEYELAAIVGVAFVGLAVCLTIICVGVVCLRRFYFLSKSKYGNSVNYSSGSNRQLVVADNVRLHHDNDQSNGVVYGHLMTGDRQYFPCDQQFVGDQSLIRN